MTTVEATPFAWRAISWYGREPAGAAQPAAFLHPARHRCLRRPLHLRRLPRRAAQPERVQLAAAPAHPGAHVDELRAALREVGVLPAPDRCARAPEAR